MAKTRVAVRLKEKVGGKKSHNKSEDLARLTERYNVFCKRLEGLVAALKNQHSAMLSLAKSRYVVAQHLAVLSKDTDLFEHVGQMPGADRSTDSVNSYLSVQEGVANKSKMYASKYAQFVVSYAEEWYKVVSKRVGEGIKKAEELRVELDHYQSKVEGLRQNANSIMAKGKQVDTKSAERLTRNEDKLIKIKESTNKFTSDLCVLMEEVTDRSWRDLHPLLIKIAQFDVTLSKDEAAAIASLNNVVSELKKVAVTHGIKPQARLKDLENLDPSQLTTRKSDASGHLALENGFAGIALGGSATSTFSSNNDMRFPPGTTAPQGLGGFPVKINSGDQYSGYDLGRTSSFDGSASGYSSGATGGPPSTMDMMAISASAAPAPTVDALAQAFGPSASLTGPSSGGAPNLSRNRNQSLDSMDSFHSGRSGASAPPPAAPPPPPPAGSSSSGYNPFGSATSGPSPAAPPSSFPSSFGSQPLYGGAAPSMSMYGTGSNPPSAPSSYGMPMDPYAPMGGNFAQQPSYGQPPAPNSYGAPPTGYGQYGQPPPPHNNSTNPFG
ncbi:hypothetical protein IV203_031537 [Nitzschia inconspicua]|uniref:Uncharacterized protein n=1 Tax=Nitzschia inconspicua TaxID=303405 RepID=A0A9K3LUH0_9STRA|nr:hypothetical protein IV203_031537 [Nitzschia inconspicua]